MKVIPSKRLLLPLALAGFAAGYLLTNGLELLQKRKTRKNHSADQNSSETSKVSDKETEKQ